MSQINPLADADNLIPLSVVARRLKVNPQTVKNWHDRGQLDAVKLGGRWYTTEEAINAHANRNEIDQQDSPSPSSSGRKSNKQTAASKRLVASEAHQQALRNLTAKGLYGKTVSSQ